jgi:CBS domain-containing protein
VTRKVRDIMAPAPVCMTSIESVASAARTMRDQAIGTVLVLENGELRGILTDRDIVVRAIAEGRDPETTRVGDICSKNLIVLGPDADLDDVTRVIREHAVRRVPVVEGGTPVGVVSTADLALWRDETSPLADRDETSPLADLAAAPPHQ